MEDQTRGLDSDQIKIPPSKSEKSNGDKLTIMVIRSVGKMRSFKISHRIILISSLFLLVFIISSLFIFNMYFNLRFKFTAQNDKLEKIEKSLRSTKKSVHQKNLYIAGLEDYIRSMREEFNDSSGKFSKKKSSGAELTNKTAEDLKKVNPASETSSEDVEIKDVAFTRTGSTLTLDFKLANNKSDETAAEGYIHIIALDKNKDNPAYWNYPRDELSNGMPVNYRKGQPFLIQRFKPYHRQFNIGTDNELPSFIKILVYDQSGQLILEKEFPVINKSSTGTM